MIFWPVDYVGEDILMTAVVLNDWYRWTSLMIAIPSFPVLVYMGQYDNVVPWISGLYAVFRAGFFVAYLILMMNWLTAIVGKEKVEQPDQEPKRCERCEHDPGTSLEPSQPSELESKSDDPATEPDKTHSD